LLQNIQTGAGPGRVAPPMTATTPIPLSSITNPNHPLNMNLPRIQRRPAQYTIPNPNIIPNPNTMNAYGGAYNNYPYRLGNMNMGAFNPYSAYGQQTNSQFLNP